MKTTYAFLLSGAMLMGISLTSCSGENTTGVETGTTANEANSEINGGGGTEDYSGADTTGMTGGNNANSAGNTLQGNSDETAGADTARTTTPSTDLQ